MTKKKKPSAKAKSRPKATPKGKRVKRTLPFPLTDEEKSLKGQEAAKLSLELDELTRAKKAKADEFKAQITDRAAAVRRLLLEINEGIEKREADCTEVKNFDTQKVEYWADGRKLEERDMTEVDRQDELPIKEKLGKLNEAPKTVQTKVASITAMRKKKGGEDAEEPTMKIVSDQDREIAEMHREETSAKESWSAVNGPRG